MQKHSDTQAEFHSIPSDSAEYLHRLQFSENQGGRGAKAED